jgi:hypothetical protein
MLLKQALKVIGRRFGFAVEEIREVEPEKGGG